MKLLLFVAADPFPEAAVRMTSLLARLTRATVTLLHISPNGEGEQAVALARQRLSDVDVVLHRRKGEVTGSLVAETVEEPYDILVLEAPETGTFKSLLASSRVRKVIRRGVTSVLVVKRPPEYIGRILVCTGGTAVAEPVVEMAARLAEAAGARVTVLFVAGSIPSMYTGMSEIDESLPKLLDSDSIVARHLLWCAQVLSQHQVASELELRHGVVADEILREAQKGEHDLIVLGAPISAGFLHSWLMGDVVGDILERADRPVLVVKHAS